jgi:hypothetical protein
MATYNLCTSASVTLYSGNSAKVQVFSAVNQAATADGARVVFTSPYQYNSCGFQLKYSCKPGTSPQPIVSLVSNQDIYVANKSHGGFVYLSLGQMVDGGSQSMEIDLSSYRGLKPPSFFVGMNRVPTLESNDWTNTTVADNNGGYLWRWYQQSPRNGNYILGMFLYGTFGGVYANNTWRYKYDTITINAAAITKTVSAQWCGQFNIPQGSKSFNLQVSREAPGGYPIFYVGKGYKPSSYKNDYSMDTNKNSYQEITVKSPNDKSYTGPNPGLWVICTQVGFSGAFVLGVTV